MHITCPHCRNPIEVVEVQPREEMVCPSCGSSFQLEGGSTQPLTLGKLGKFELLALVGHGAFGSVYKGRDPALDRTVAIKVPRAGNLAGPEELDRFVREARSVAQLRHPGVVPVFEVGQHVVDGAGAPTPYLVSEFVEGITLANLLSARRPTFEEAAQIISQVADALQYAHDMGVVHRDVKPSNIMLEVGGVVSGGVVSGEKKDASQPHHSPLTTHHSPRLMDFGLAKRDTGEVTMTVDGQILGTPAYMSPEQAGGWAHQVDGRSDVYSLGVILYQVLTGELPFRGTTRMLLHQVLREEPRPPRKINDRIPRDLETICLKAIAKEPARRYPTARALADDLRRWLSHEPIQARPVGSLERLGRWCRRNPLVAGLSAAVVFLLLAGSITATVLALQADQARLEAEEIAEAEGKALKAEAKARSNAQKALKAETKAKADTQKALKGEKATSRKLKNSLAETQRYLANSQVLLAQAAWDRNNAALAHERLDAVPVKERFWEWFYLKRLYTGGLFTLHGHAATVSSVAFNSDGTRLASGSWDNTVKVWDARTGTELRILKGHTFPVTSVAFSPDGTRLASGSWDQTVKLWDACTGAELRTLIGHTASVSSVAFSSDGTRVASGSYDKTVKIWDSSTGSELRTLQGHAKEVASVAFSPDGTRVASGSYDNTLKIWDSRTGTELRTLQGHTSWVSSVAFSPDGTRLASGSLDKTVKVWDARTGTELLTLKGHSSKVTSVAFSPDGSLASGSQDQAVKMWDARTGTDLRTLQGHTSWVSSVAFSPDGTRLASGSFDKTVKVWDARTGPELRTLKGHTYIVTSVAFSPDGTRLASGSKTVKVWDARTGTELRTLKGHTFPVTSVAFSPDGTRLASGSDDQTVTVWDARTGTERRTLIGHTASVSSVAFSPDGTRLASGSVDKTVKVWNARTGTELLSLKGHSDWVTSVAFSPDGTRLASGSLDKTVKVWDTRTGTEVRTLKGHTSSVDSVAFSPDGTRLASGSFDQTVKVWDARTGTELRTLQGHTSWVSSVAFSPDGTRLASGGDDQTVKVWDARTGTELLTLKGHSSKVTSVAFSPDGSLASGSEDQSVKMWDARKGAELRILEGHAERVGCVAFSPDGTRLASGSKDQTVKVWDARTGTELRTLKGHTDGVTSVAFSLDGTHLASGSNQTVKVWDARTGTELRTLKGHSDWVTSLAFSPDGTRVISRDMYGKTIVWNLKSGQPMKNVQKQHLWVENNWNQAKTLFAHADRNVIRLIRKPTAEEIEERRRLTRFDPPWHQSEADRHEKAGHWFAAVFHIDQLRRHGEKKPALWAQRNRVLREALKRDPKDSLALLYLIQGTWEWQHLTGFPRR